MKSPPELWAEISDAGALAGHLGAFGEIRITRLEPETTVAWEGDRARGTVELEPAGWGTRVTLTASIAAEAEEEEEAPAHAEPEAELALETPAAPEPPAGGAESPRRRRRWWPFARRRADAPHPVVEAPPEPRPAPVPAAAEPAPDTTPASLDARRAEDVLSGVLDDLGAAHHRPFSRG